MISEPRIRPNQTGPVILKLLDQSVSAQVNIPSPAVARVAPTQSSGCLPGALSSTKRHAMATTAAATGTLIKKIVGQPATSISHPPKGGPTALAIAPAAAHVPIARPF